MAISTLHKLDKIVLPSSVEFTQIHSQRWVAGIESMLEHPAGHAFPMFRANMRQRPVLEFTTSQIGTLLGAVGVGGAALGSVATYFKKASQTGNVGRSSEAHQKITIASSFAHWTNIRLPHNARGEAQVVLTAVYDGSNDPFVHAASQALSGTLTAAAYFGCGPVAINGTAIPGIQEITIESGVRLIQEGGASEEFDTFVGLEVAQPVVTIRTLEVLNWATLGLRGLALDGEDGLEFYARKLRVSNATTGHIYFQGLNGTAIPVDSNGNETGPVSDTLRVELIAGDDDDLPLVGTVGVAIS